MIPILAIERSREFAYFYIFSARVEEQEMLSSKENVVLFSQMQRPNEVLN